jgi:hypothetical protein
MANTKTVQYLNRDFDSLKAQLVNFAKIYYPNTYNDFTDASPGMMLIEMASYVGDVLSFYIDNQIQENFLQFAKQRKNLLAIAYNFGYRPKVTSASSVDVNIYQAMPAILTGSQYVPDFRYALILEEGTQLQSSINNTAFYINEKIDFSNSGSSPIDISVLNYDPNTGIPLFYLLQKTAKATAGALTTTTFTFNNPERFPTITLTDNNVIDIISVVDSDNNKWYEVPYLAQDTIFEPTANIASNDYTLAQYSDTTPYLLKLKKVPRRFVSRFKTNNTLELQFGPGVSSGADEEIIPNPDNIGLGLPYGVDKMMTAWDPSNFLYTQTYGLAPSNTTLTVTYLVGGGIESNQPVNTITQKGFTVGNISFKNFLYISNPTLANTLFDSLTFNNPYPSLGGRDGDTVEEIRQNTLSSFSAQDRVVTQEDYINRSLSMPSQYGNISKVYIENTNQKLSDGTINYSALDLYVLAYDSNKNLTTATTTLKNNLATYLNNYRMLTDAINIKDAYYINIGVNFDITTIPQASNREALNACLTSLKNYFAIDNWQLNKPIILADVYSLLLKIPLNMPPSPT